MSDFGDAHQIRARKRHRCVACYGPIAEGEQHWQYSGMYDGAWQHWRMHNECYAAYEADGDYEFLPGELPGPERLLEGKATKGATISNEPECYGCQVERA